MTTTTNRPELPELPAPDWSGLGYSRPAMTRYAMAYADALDKFREGTAGGVGAVQPPAPDLCQFCGTDKSVGMHGPTVCKSPLIKGPQPPAPAGLIDRLEDAACQLEGANPHSQDAKDIFEAARLLRVQPPAPEPLIAKLRNYAVEAEEAVRKGFVYGLLNLTKLEAEVILASLATPTTQPEPPAPEPEGWFALTESNGWIEVRNPSPEGRKRLTPLYSREQRGAALTDAMKNAMHKVVAHHRGYRFELLDEMWGAALALSPAAEGEEDMSLPDS